MRKVLIATSLVIATFANEFWIGVGKIGGDPVTSTEWAIGFEKEIELFEEWISGIDISYKYARIKEVEEEKEIREEEHQLREGGSKKVDENAIDIEALLGKAFDHHNKLFAVGGLRYGESDGDEIYGIGVGVEFQHILENDMVVSVDVIRHFMKNSDKDEYYQTNTLMIKLGYEF